jgi:hypothetical protein
MVLLKKIVPLWMLGVLFIITGCASNRIYRTDYTACAGSSGSQCVKHSLQEYNVKADNEYMLGVC